MTVDHNDTIYGWIPDPDNMTSVILVDQDLNSETWQFARYRISHGRASVISAINTESVSAGGVLDILGGNAPVNLKAEALNGGLIKVTWNYNTLFQPRTPTGFKVYRWDDPAWTLVDTVAYTGGRSYSYTSGAKTHGVSYTYRVRAYATVSESDYEEANTNSASATADTTGPPAITVITVAVA